MRQTKSAEVFRYFQKSSVAAIRITDGQLKVGDKVHFLGNTTDHTQAIDSMQSENAQIREANAGDLVGVKVCQRVRPNDIVYRVED